MKRQSTGESTGKKTGQEKLKFQRLIILSRLAGSLLFHEIMQCRDVYTHRMLRDKQACQFAWRIQYNETVFQWECWGKPTTFHMFYIDFLLISIPISIVRIETWKNQWPTVWIWLNLQYDPFFYADQSVDPKNTHEKRSSSQNFRSNRSKTRPGIPHHLSSSSWSDRQAFSDFRPRKKSFQRWGDDLLLFNSTRNPLSPLAISHAFHSLSFQTGK